MGYEVRAARPEEWRNVKDIRLDALRDPLSRIAFASTYEREVAFSDEVWRRRARDSMNFIGEGESGDWLGMVTVLIESGTDHPVPQSHIVGMYVRSELRGSGLAESLLQAGVEWSWQRPEIERVRLWVTEANDRAFAFYSRIGFTKSGATMPYVNDPAITELELELLRRR